MANARRSVICWAGGGSNKSRNALSAKRVGFLLNPSVNPAGQAYPTGRSSYLEHCRQMIGPTAGEKTTCETSLDLVESRFSWLMVTGWYGYGLQGLRRTDSISYQFFHLGTMSAIVSLSLSPSIKNPHIKLVSPRIVLGPLGKPA